MYRVVIDYDKCIGCGNCVKACAMGVLEMIDDEPYPVNPKDCHGCQECEKSCEQGAIKVIYLGNKNNLFLREKGKG